MDRHAAVRPAVHETEPDNRVPMAIYLIIPPDLPDLLLEPLREHVRGEPGIEVIVDRRGADRSGKGRYRERRRSSVAPVIPSLPPAALLFLGRLEFRELTEPRSVSERDAEGARLLERVRAGDASAFDVLYARYFDGVYGYLRVVLGDPHEAEDLTQQVWLRVDRALDHYPPRGVPVRAWLFRIARGRLIDELKRRGRVRVDPLEPIERHAPGDVDPGLGQRWFADPQIEEALNQLALGQREVVVLRYLVGLSYEEMASVTGKQAPALRQLNSRALRELSRQLHQNPEDPPKDTSSERNSMWMRLRPMPVLRERRSEHGC
jgi:RNA polymerase sigma-70 factor (ECF subfamily)